MQFFKLWDIFTNKNMMPYPGSYMDQPYLLTEAFSLLDAFIGKCMEFKAGK